MVNAATGAATLQTLYHYLETTMSLSRRLLLLALTAVLSAPVFARTLEESYDPVKPPQPTQSAGKIEVIEFFWYGCPHCYSMESYVEKWLATKPDDVAFIRIPAVLNKTWMIHARAYYTAQKLGVLDKIHRPLFDAIHRDNRKIFSEEELHDFFVEQGVDGDEFTRVFNSNETEIRIKQAFVLARNYRITGVPAFIVNGKYMTGAAQAGSYEDVMRVVDQLVDIERKANGK